MLTGQHIFGLVIALAPYFSRGRCEPVGIAPNFQADCLPDCIVYMAFCRVPQFDYRMGIFVPHGVIEQVRWFVENEIRKPDFFYASARVGAATSPPDGPL